MKSSYLYVVSVCVCVCMCVACMCALQAGTIACSFLYF